MCAAAVDAYERKERTGQVKGGGIGGRWGADQGAPHGGEDVIFLFLLCVGV